MMSSSIDMTLSLYLCLLTVPAPSLGHVAPPKSFTV